MRIQYLLPLAAMLLLGACQERVGEREEALGPHVHRLTVDIDGDGPSEARLGNAADAVCPAGYTRQSDETMPPNLPAYRVWLVRCK